MEVESPVKVLCMAFVPDLERTAGTEADIEILLKAPIFQLFLPPIFKKALTVTSIPLLLHPQIVLRNLLSWELRLQLPRRYHQKNVTHGKRDHWLCQAPM
jgi:hypothetical protein